MNVQNRRNRNKNREKTVSPDELKKLALKEKDMERLFREQGRFTRNIGHRGF